MPFHWLWSSNQLYNPRAFFSPSPILFLHSQNAYQGNSMVSMQMSGVLESLSWRYGNKLSDFLRFIGACVSVLVCMWGRVHVCVESSESWWWCSEAVFIAPQGLAKVPDWQCVFKYHLNFRIPLLSLVCLLRLLILNLFLATVEQMICTSASAFCVNSV